MKFPSPSEIKAMSADEREALTHKLLAAEAAAMKKHAMAETRYRNEKAWIERVQGLFAEYPECKTTGDIDEKLKSQGKPGLFTSR